MSPELHSLVLLTDGPLFATLLKGPPLTFHVFSFLLRAKEPFSSPFTRLCPHILSVNARPPFPASYFCFFGLSANDCVNQCCCLCVSKCTRQSGWTEVLFFFPLNLSFFKLAASCYSNLINKLFINMFKTHAYSQQQPGTINVEERRLFLC